MTLPIFNVAFSRLFLFPSYNLYYLADPLPRHSSFKYANELLFCKYEIVNLLIIIFLRFHVRIFAQINSVHGQPSCKTYQIICALG